MNSTILEQVKLLRIEDYTYALPDEKIAKYPLEKRDASKLLIFENNEIRESTFSSLHNYLENNSLLVFNNTKVIRARLFFRKNTGALIEIFCLEPALPADYERAFKQTGNCEWFCIVGNLKRWKNEILNLEVTVGSETIILNAEKVQNHADSVQIRFKWKGNFGFGEILEAAGNIPIPPYLNRNPEASDLLRYQTVYSKTDGSVAAPTAGLHFTAEVFSELKQKGIKLQEVTLHVGAGTFKPVKVPTIAEHEMHTEHYFITKEVLTSVINAFPNVTAVGTTSVRTLESMYWAGVKILSGTIHSDADLHIQQWNAYELPQHYSLLESYRAVLFYLEEKQLEFLPSSTQIIIAPNYKFRVVNAIITNFHQPQSTLLLLIAAFAGKSWKAIYDYALANNFRFLSYGDSSLLKV